MEQGKGFSDGTELGPIEKRESLIWTEPSLGCVVHIGSWLQRKKEPGKKWEVHKFGVNLSYMESAEVPDGDFEEVIRYDCQHYHAEIHEFWKSGKPVPVKWAKDKPKDQIFRICVDDIRSNFKDYIRQIRIAKAEKRKGSASK